MLRIDFRSNYPDILQRNFPKPKVHFFRGKWRYVGRKTISQAADNAPENGPEFDP